MHSETEQVLTDIFAEIGKSYARTGNALVAAINETMVSLRPTFEAITKAAQIMYEAIYQAYLDEGAIYGESHEGMIGWLDEKAEMARHEHEAERLKHLHWDLADLRQRMDARII